LRIRGLLGDRRVGLRVFLGLRRPVVPLFTLRPFSVLFTRVVGYVPSRSLELERSARDQLSDLAFAGGTTTERLVGDPLGNLERTAVPAAVFVNGHRF